MPCEAGSLGKLTAPGRSLLAAPDVPKDRRKQRTHTGDGRSVSACQQGARALRSGRRL